MAPKRNRNQPGEAHQDAPQVATTPVSRRSPRKKAPPKASGGWDPYASNEGDESPVSSPLSSPPPSPKKRRTKTTEPIVYNIPPVESKTTAFKGRLGYACLNTILRAANPPIFCSRTCRIATLKANGLSFAKNLGLENVRDLKKMILWNEENNIKFMRLSSEMFPFASHKEWGYDLEYAKEALKEAGDLANRLGHRLTTHPGQFTQIASPRKEVVEASVRELEYHCQMMRYMGLGKDSVIILHMGGVYGDKPATLARFKENYTSMLTDEMKARLVLENDEMCYDPDDLLPVCNELDIPIVLDYHHNFIKPSKLPLSELIPVVNKTWHRKGIRVKQHLSEPRPGLWYNDWTKPVATVEDAPAEDGTIEETALAEDDGEETAADANPLTTSDPEPKKANIMELRAHADRCTSLPEEVVLMGVLPDGTVFGGDGGGDLMIEAKDKEQAVFELYRMYGLAAVKHENLRPERKEMERLAELAKRERKASRSPKKKTQLEDNEPASPAGTPTRKRKKPAVAEDAASPSTLATRKRSRSRKADAAAELANLEDAPIPVDGATAEEVGADEHPEAVGAAEGKKRTRRKKAKAP